jgi:CHAT domain-containing protein/Tfp pilus assembly protein PilF
MKDHSLDIICRGLAVSLMAASAVDLVQIGYAAPSRATRANVNQSNSNVPDFKAMIERAEKLRKEGNFVAAASIWWEILTSTEKALGPNHPDVATSLNVLAGLIQKQGKYPEAETLRRRSLAIYQISLGPDHPDVATSLNNLANLLGDRGQYTEAETLYRRSLTIREHAFGKNHSSVASSINNLANLLSDRGQYTEAETLYRRSLAISETSLGHDHPGVAATLNNLATLLLEQGQFIEAESLYRRSLAISETSLGHDHPGVAATLNNLAELLRKQGQFAEAESLYRRSLAIRETVLGKDHPDIADSLSGLALLLEDQSLYVAAGDMLRRSLAIYEKALGPNHRDVAISLNNLAALLQNQGQFTEAESLYRRSLAIRETVLGKDHPDVAISLSDLALLLNIQGNYSAAEPIYRRSLAILEKALGHDHIYVAASLSGLAMLLESQDQLTKAEALLRRSLAIYQKSLGPDHPDVATTLSLLARVLKGQGQYITALSLYQRSLSIRERSLGPKHIKASISLGNLANLYMTEGVKSKAISAIKRSLAIQSTWLLRELPLLPNQYRSAQISQLGDYWELAFGWIERYPPAAQLALETRINRHGLLAEIEQQQTLKVKKIQALARQLGSVSLSADRRAEVRYQRDQLQAEIYREIPELQLQPVTTAAVAKALPADGVLVEFQRYRPSEMHNRKKEQWGPAQYIALVLKPDASVASVPLGPAASIDATIQKGLKASAEGLSDGDAIWAQLSSEVLKPLLPHLSGSRQWFFSPDGELNRVPFAALPAPQQPDTSLAQDVQLRLLTTGRELVRLQQSTLPASSALVMANPSYDRPSNKQPLTARPDGALTFAQRRSAQLGSNQWKPLPASEREGHQVASLLSTGFISGAAATTTALLRQQGPRVLHVATHGFFVVDLETKPTEAIRAIQEDSPLLRSLRQGDPLLRSGLVLAGANQPDVDPNDDGYLTAAEVVSLNLKGTELVVLSACSTGQGDVRTGEGVYGLQRSLTVAGARSTLLSLWKVDDAATSEFMTRFYKRLKAGEGRSDALAATQKEFRDGLAGKGEWKKPYYWAAWQLVGDWRPIKGL